MTVNVEKTTLTHFGYNRTNGNAPEIVTGLSLVFRLTDVNNVVLHLVKYKCTPILLYGLEVLNLNKSQLNSLDFVANRFLMKLFNTNNMQIIEFCCEQFIFILPIAVR